MKELVAAFNQEKALVGAFSVIVQPRRLIVYSTNSEAGRATAGARLGQGDDFWYFVFTQAATSHLVFVTRRRSEKD